MNNMLKKYYHRVKAGLTIFILLFCGCGQNINIYETTQSLQDYLALNGFPVITCKSYEVKSDSLYIYDADIPSGIINFPYLSSDNAETFYLIYPLSKKGVSGVKSSIFSYFSKSGNNWILFMEIEPFRIVSFNKAGTFLSEKLIQTKGLVIFPNLKGKSNFDDWYSESKNIFDLNTTVTKKGDWEKSLPETTD